MTSRIMLALATALLASTTACGGTTAPPGATVPALSTALSQVDAALAEGDHVRARQAIEALIQETITARDAGQLTSGQADRILAAAVRLAADLPPEPPAPQPTVTIQVPQDDDEDKRDDDNDRDKKDGKDRGKGGGRNSADEPDGGRDN